MKRYIEISELPNFEVKCSDGKDYILLPFKHLFDIPTADVEKVKHGKWTDNEIQGSMLSKCSLCGYPCGAYTLNYCPNCGAKMDGGDTE